MSLTTRTRSDDPELLRWVAVLTSLSRSHPAAAEAAVAVAVVLLFTVATAWMLPWQALLWSLAWLVAYLLRPVSLVAMLAAMTVVGLLQVMLHDGVVPGNFLIPMAVYQAANLGHRAVRMGALVLLVIAAAMAAITFTPDGPAWVLMGVVYAAGLLIPWLLGDMLRHRRGVVQRELDARAAREREREQQALLAVRQERATIAREMHDVIAHSLSVVIVQADGGRYAARAAQTAQEAGAQGEQLVQARAGALQGATDALEQIATTAREALAETRRLVSVLRDPDGETEYGPGQGLQDLRALLTRLEEAHLPVQSVLDPTLWEAMGFDPEPEVPQIELPSTLSAAAYRVIQESTTNVIKHAGAISVLRIRVGIRDGVLAVSVADDGAGPTASGEGRGHGILGMHERVAALGGELLTGMRNGGGFLVRATFPLAPSQRSALTPQAAPVDSHATTRPVSPHARTEPQENS